MQGKNVDGFKPIEYLMNKVQDSTKDKVDTSKENAASLFSEMTKIMDADGSYGNITNKDMKELLSNKFDISDEDKINEAIDFLASMDDSGKNISYADLGIYQFSGDILSTAGEDLSEDNIKNIATIIHDAVKSKDATAESLLASIKDEINVKDDDKMLDVINDVINQKTAKATTNGENITTQEFTLSDVEEYAKASVKTDNNSTSEVIQTSTDTKTDEAGSEKESTSGNISSIFKGSATSKIQTDKNTGEYFVTSDSWDANKSDNLDCVSRIIYNLYGVSYDSQEGKKIHQALIEKNPEFFKDGNEMVYANQKLILVDPNSLEIAKATTEETEEQEEENKDDKNESAKVNKEALKSFTDAIKSGTDAGEAVEKYIDSNKDLDDKEKAKLMKEQVVIDAFNDMEDKEFEELYNSKLKGKATNMSSTHSGVTAFNAIINNASRSEPEETVDKLIDTFGKDGLLELLNGKCSSYRATVFALMAGYDSETLFE